MFLEEESYNKYRSDAKALVPIGHSAVCGEGKVQIITGDNEYVIGRNG